MTSRSKYLEEARRYIGVKHVHQGRSIHGIDCVGLVTVPMRDLGAEHVWRLDRENRAYSRWPDGVTLVRCFDHALVRKPGIDVQVGDVPVFRIGRKPRHCGWIDEFNGELYLIHSLAGRRVCRHRLDDRWRKLIIVVYEPPLLPTEERTVHSPQAEYVGPRLM